MLFEELGLRYFGPIDGHNIGLLRKYLKMVKDLKGPMLLHVVTEKGHGFKPAAEDPGLFPHAAGIHAGKRHAGAEEAGSSAGVHESAQRRDLRADAEESRESRC